MNNKLLTAAMMILAVFSAALAQTSNRVFRGFISGSPVQITLTRDGEKLFGTYFYTRVGRELKLDGTIDGAGNFKLTEADATGKRTGEFSGKWTEDENANGASLEGSWQKPGGKSGDESGFSAGEQIIEFSNGTTISSKNFKEINKPKRFEISVEYPQLAGANAAKFNLLAKTKAMADVAGFRKDAQGLTAADLKTLPANSYLDVGYEIEWANDELVSISFTNSSFTGGIHPNYNFTTLNYDLKNDREIKFVELFKPKSNYVKFISDYTIAVLKKRQGEYADSEWLKTGAGPAAKNFAAWNLTKKGLEISFDPYQVASYAEGQQLVIVPYSDLKKILQPQFMH